MSFKSPGPERMGCRKDVRNLHTQERFLAQEGGRERKQEIEVLESLRKGGPRDTEIFGRP